MKQFRGTYTAIITPFDTKGNIDWKAFEVLVEKQIEAKVEGIVFVGTTGESPTLTEEEHYEILKWSVKVVHGRCQVIHGTGSNSTKEAIEYAKVAAAAKADGQLVVNPYYNKPTQQGLFEHFTAIADATKVPVILYNIKGRTGVNLETPTLLKLMKHKNIVAMKEASGDIEQMMDVITQAPKDFSVLVGDDTLILPFMSLGGDGVISVASNVIPKTVKQVIDTLLAGDFEKGAELFYKIRPIMKTVFIETNPIPAKEMAALLKLCKPDLRLPMTRASETSMKKIAEMVELIKRVEK